jgi:hypothetical protein
VGRKASAAQAVVSEALDRVSAAPGRVSVEWVSVQDRE